MKIKYTFLYLILLLLLIPVLSGSAQNSLFKKSISERELLSTIAGITHTFTTKNQDSIYSSYFKQLGYKVKKNPKIKIASLLLQAEYIKHYNKEDTQTVIKVYKSSARLAEDNGLSTVEAYVYYRLGRYLYELENRTEAIEYLFYTRELMNEQGYASFPDGGSFLYLLGQVYADYKDYDSAKKTLLKATRYPFMDDRDKLRYYRLMTLVYSKLNHQDSATRYADTAIQIALKMNDSLEYASISGDAGAVNFSKSNLSEAHRLLDIDYSISSQYGHWESAFNALVLKAVVYDYENKVEKAEAVYQILDSIATFYRCPSPLVLAILYKGKASIASKKACYQQAVTYLDSFVKYNEQHIKKTNVDVFKNMELKAVGRMHDTKMELIKSEKKQQIFIRNALIIIFLLIVTIVLSLFYKQREKRKLEKEIFQQKINNAKHTLNTYLENIRQKNELVDKLSMEIANQQDQTSQNENEIIANEHILTQLKNANIITEEGWNHFTRLVEEVHHHFFVRLKQKLPDLTPGDIRILTLTKLKFSTREMAGMLGISPDSVKKARQRLRKKLHIKESESLDDVIADL